MSDLIRESVYVHLPKLVYFDLLPVSVDDHSCMKFQFTALIHSGSKKSYSSRTSSHSNSISCSVPSSRMSTRSIPCLPQLSRALSDSIRNSSGSSRSCQCPSVSSRRHNIFQPPASFVCRPTVFVHSLAVDCSHCFLHSILHILIWTQLVFRSIIFDSLPSNSFLVKYSIFFVALDVPNCEVTVISAPTFIATSLIARRGVALGKLPFPLTLAFHLALKGSPLPTIKVYTSLKTIYRSVITNRPRLPISICVKAVCLCYISPRFKHSFKVTCTITTYLKQTS